MIDDLDLKALRRVPRITYYFRYPLHRNDFHAMKVRNELRGHYAAKPLYGRLASNGHVDRSAGYNGDVAALYVPVAARGIDDISLLKAHVDPQEVTLPSGRRNWPAIRMAAEKEIFEAIRGEREGKSRPEIQTKHGETR